MEPVIQNNIQSVIYCTTNIINGKKYIGRDLYNNDQYLGSGKILKQAIKKHGKENFKKQILQDCINPEDLNESEKYWIDYFGAVKSDLFYNIAEGGRGGDLGEEVNRRKSLKLKGRKKSEKHKLNLKLAKLKSTYVISKETREKLSKSNKGKKRTEETKLKMRTSFKGRVVSKESVIKAQATKKSRIYIYSESRKQVARLRRLGFVHSKDTIDKISKSHKVKERFDCSVCGKNVTAANLKRWHNSNCGVKQSKPKLPCSYCGKSYSNGLLNRWHNENCKLNPNITQKQLDKRVPWGKSKNN